MSTRQSARIDRSRVNNPVLQRISAAGRGRRLSVLSLTLFIGVVIVAGFATIQIMAARHHLYAGVNDLRQTRAGFHLNLASATMGTNGQTRRSLAAAEREFASAHADLFLWSPILVRLAWLPRIGEEVANAPPATDAAWYATRSALDLVEGLAPLEAQLSSPTRHRQLLNVLGAVLVHAHPRFTAASDEADRSAAALHELPVSPRNTTLATAGQQLRRTVPLLTSVSRWLSVAPNALGYDRPHHYLLLLQNPANLAPTGGMIGALDYITVDHASLHSNFSSVKLPHQITSVAAPLPEELYSPIGYWTLLDSNWSPDFPLSARIARWFYGEDTGQWSDGVVALLDPGIVRLLGATGPVYVPAYHRWVAATNVESLSQFYVKGSAYHGPSRVGMKDTVRKQFLGYVVHALVTRLQQLPRARWSAVGVALEDAVATREIQLYDRRPTVQSAIRSSGADGSLQSSPGDFLAIVDFNESDSKLNPYVHQRAQYHAVIGPDLWIDSTLSIQYSVAASPANLEGHGPALGLQGTKHDYDDYLRVYVPRGAQLVGTSGLEPWAPLPAYGLTQFGGRFIVREGQTRTITIHYRIPANALAGSSAGQYTLAVRHQPGANLTSLRVTIDALGGVTLGPKGTASLTRTLSLDRDAGLQLDLHGSLHPRSILLPHAPGPIDPYLPFSDFRDPKHPY
jgi:Protein of unknown function (DUF4012)